MVFAVERIVGGVVGRRLETQAINQRLDLIGRGVSRGEAMQLLRRRVKQSSGRACPDIHCAAGHRVRKDADGGRRRDADRAADAVLLLAPVLIFFADPPVHGRSAERRASAAGES